jgi:hypothetical protein
VLHVEFLLASGAVAVDALHLTLVGRH